MGSHSRVPKLMLIGYAGAASLFLTEPGFAFCNPRLGDSATCVQDIELNPRRLTSVAISTQSVMALRRLLNNHEYLGLPDIRIALEQISQLLTTESSVGYYYDVPIDSYDKTTDCQLYNFSNLPPNPLGVSLLHSLDCTLAAEIILQFTLQVVDIQEEARKAGFELTKLTDAELIELYSSTRYFNTAISYAFHEMKGPAYEYYVDAPQVISEKAWPWGLTESGVFLPPGGVVEYTVQPGDSWQSISSTFVGDPAQGADVAQINLDDISNIPPAGEQIYVPLDIADWVRVDMNTQTAEEVAQQIYGDKAFSEMITRRCRVSAGILVPKCVVPIFHDVRSVYEAFFAE